MSCGPDIVLGATTSTDTQNCWEEHDEEDNFFNDDSYFRCSDRSPLETYATLEAYAAFTCAGLGFERLGLGLSVLVTKLCLLV